MKGLKMMMVVFAAALMLLGVGCEREQTPPPGPTGTPPATTEPTQPGTPPPTTEPTPPGTTQPAPGHEQAPPEQPKQ